ncbi:L-type lectin-domain containing receptor kinase IX.1-like [Bidens hawaiensis]|uniref:L-type lectin-domain containing receptor kinase IX.1-like n=1 Tax=Bidens hawaiensis TaxID=980011 RepID=UPI00404B8879
MAFSHTHLITSFLLVFFPSIASLTFNFTYFNNQNRDIILEGDGSYISYEGIQVTPNELGSDRSQKAGRATYSTPLHLWDNRSGELASFSTNFTFVIDSMRSTSYGDGLAFFLAQNNSNITRGGAMGLPIHPITIEPTSKFVAVEFDTFWNDRWDPKVWDPIAGANHSVGDHVGISISSLTSVRSQKWFSNITGGAVCQAWIAYDSVSKNLSVSFTSFQNNATVRQDGLVYTVDLRNELPERVIFSFSAATGSAFEKNNVRSWMFNSSDIQIDEKSGIPPVPGPDQLNPGPDPVKENESKVGLIVGISGTTIVFLSVFAFLLWWRKKKKSMEHEAEENSFDVEMDSEFEMGTGPKRFSYQELAHSTSHFAEKEKLGEGGFGGVYRGFLKDSDVFSFGVVALEIACGRKPIEKQILLSEWVWQLYGTGTLLEAADPSLEDFEEEEIKRLMIVGLWCVHPDSKFRPSMRQAIKVLNFEDSLPILPSKMPVASYLTPPVSSVFHASSVAHYQSSSSSAF